MGLSKQISCRHCGNISQMEVIGEVNDKQSGFDERYGGNYHWGTSYSILKCPACEKINIVSYYWDEEMDSDDVSYDFLYPPISNYPIGLPEEILTSYKAAERVKSIDVNAYAILMRRLLEKVCLDKKATVGTLASMLNELSNKKEIPEKLVKVAMGLKDFGNIGAHAGSGELTEKEIPIVNALCSAILEYVYSAPYLATIAENKLKTIKTKSKR